MLVRKLKWRGAAEPELVWSFEAERLGKDSYGSWFAAPRGTPVVRRDATHEQWADGLLLFAPDHVAAFWRPAAGAGGPDLTVDVAERVRAPEYVDLELDIFRYPDGRVEGTDEADLQRALAAGWMTQRQVAAALAVWDHLLAAVAEREPFRDVALSWWERWDGGR